MGADYKDRLSSLQGEITESIVELVKIPSVIHENEGGKIFGTAIDMALKNTLSLCERLGFETFYQEQGYYGWAQTGEGSEMAVVLIHLDVVPEGDPAAWKYPPFSGTVADGRIYGRGVQDNKAPGICALYGAKALLDCGYRFKKRLRFVFGTDEENLWRCMKEYVKNEEMPDCGFAPDSKFPLTNAEKGLLQLKVRGRGTADFRAKAGSAFNVVPDRAVYEGGLSGKLKDQLDLMGFVYEDTASGITVMGKSAHASVPGEGINAIARLCMGLSAAGCDNSLVRFIAENLGECFYGEKINPLEDKASGKLTVNLGHIDIHEEYQEAWFDLRIPVSFQRDEILAPFTAKAEAYGLEVTEYDFQPSLYIPEDHVLIQTLRKVYEEETGLDGTPMSSGGATYARAMPNCVAFGPCFPGEPKVEHQTDEYVTLQNVLKVAGIYATAIKELTDARQ